MIVEVITTLYSFPRADFFIEEAQIGDILEINIMNKEYFGIVCNIKTNSPFKLKNAMRTEYNVSTKFVNYIIDFSFHNFISESFIVKYITEKLPKKYKSISFDTSLSKEINLFDEQQNAYEIVKNAKNSLLWGITGSGKTEIFFKIIKDNIVKNQQTLLLLPEIAITEAVSSRFKKTFGFEPIIWHSTSQSSKKFAAIIRGDLPVVIGSRSAILLPFKKLNTIIVDEEHDRSYKQEVIPCYNARDMALLRSKIEDCQTIFASATPSLESFYNSKRGLLTLAKINKRYSNAPLPCINIIPNYVGILSNQVIEKTNKYLENGHQAIFYLNKRGFASFSYCKSCVRNIVCTECNISLSWHKHAKILLCHQCNKKYPVAICPHCQTYGSISSYGVGVEKLAQILSDYFPDKNIYVASSDFLEKRSEIADFIEKVKNKEVDIIVGTQIVSKGHDFPGIALIVLVNFSETGFDFRASETNMQNLVQLSGRAGRAGISAEVIIQTNKTESSTLNFLKNNDYEGFLEKELQKRKLWSLPPFCRIIALKSSSKNVIDNVYILLKNQFTCHLPNESFLFFKKYYYMILKTDKTRAALEILKNSLSGIKISINVDPYDLYL